EAAFVLTVRIQRGISHPLLSRGRSGEVNKQFKGTIDIDIGGSVPDWAPFGPPKAPDGAPNVVYIVLDDVGFSAMSCYGGPIESANIKRIRAPWVRDTDAL